MGYQTRKRPVSIRRLASPTRFLVGVLAACTFPGFSVADSNIEKASHAWRKRQDSFRSGKFEWTEDVFYRKGSIRDPTTTRESKPTADYVPPRDFSYQSEVRVSFAEVEIRYAYERLEWLPGASEPNSQSSNTVFDGEATQCFWPSGSTKWPVGHLLSPKRKFIEASNYHTWPVLMTYRNLLAGMQLISFDSFREAETNSTVNGRRCIVLDELPLPGKDRRRTLWIDTERDFTLARFEASVDGRPIHRIEVEYIQDKEHGWIPHSWRITELNSDLSLNRSFSAKVSKWSLNVPLPEGEFRIEFPEGTVVRDERQGQPQTYVVRKEGKKRPVLSNELGATYEQVVSSEPGTALASGRGTALAQPGWQLSTPWIVAFLIVGALVVLIGRRVWRRSPRMSGRS
ncbi:MAG: hypothetical protein L0Y71_20320 [Gemmataceae bacterium]|nr:hypothetical protein [Gemmataceae bacterium]